MRVKVCECFRVACELLHVFSFLFRTFVNYLLEVVGFSGGSGAR